MKCVEQTQGSKDYMKMFMSFGEIEGGFQDPEKLEVGKREEEEEAEREGSKGGRKPDFTTIAIGVDGSH